MVPKGSRSVWKYRENLDQLPAWGFIGVWLIPECTDVTVIFRESDGPFRGATIWGKFDSMFSGRMGLYRLDYQIKGYQECKRGEGVSLKHSPLHWKRGGLPGFGYHMCGE